jgi:hypothetical protein
MLDSNKSERLLKWKPKYDLNKSVKLIVEWHKNYLKNGNIFKFSQQQIFDYFN